MPDPKDRNQDRQHRQRIEYLADFPGADVAGDRLKIYIEDSGNMGDDIENLRNNIAQESTLSDILSKLFNASDNVVIEEASPLDVSASAIEIGTWSAGVLSVQEDTALDVSASTVPVSHQGVIDVSSRDGRNLGDVDVTALNDTVGVEDSTQTQVDPDVSPDYPAVDIDIHDLDPTNGAGDFTTTVSVGRTEALLIAANSQDNNNWSVSVEWQTANGNTTRTQSASDINLSNVDNDDARLTRKGPQAVITITSNVADGTQNRISGHIGAHK